MSVQAQKKGPWIMKDTWRVMTTPCLNCEATAHVDFEKFAHKMFRCRDCGFLFTHPAPPPTEVEARYALNWFEREYLPSYGIDPANPSLTHLGPRYARELDPLTPYRKLNRLLDVGAGAGLLLSQAQSRGWEIFGVELSTYGPAYAKKHFAIDITQGKLEDARYPDGHFDVVMLQDTIEHVPNPKSLLSEIHRILRPGGALVISTPNYNSLGRRFFGSHWALISPVEHLCLFTPRSLKKLLVRTGFGIARLETSAGINSALTHSPELPIVQRRQRTLRRLLNRLPAPLLWLFRCGDEIYCRAVKR